MIIAVDDKIAHQPLERACMLWQACIATEGLE